MYISALKRLIWQLTRRPRVTAGFRWAPLMWPTLCAMVAMASPNASETFTLSWVAVTVVLEPRGKLKPSAEPMLMKIKRLMAKNSATTALQKAFFLNSLAIVSLSPFLSLSSPAGYFPFEVWGASWRKNSVLGLFIGLWVVCRRKGVLHKGRKERLHRCWLLDWCKTLHACQSFFFPFFFFPLPSPPFTGFDLCCCFWEAF